ncbi:MAG: hypothetical protein WB755_18530 [Terriglobales bacterium]
MPLRFADGVFGFASGDVEDLLGKLGGITRTFGHDASMPQARTAVPCYEISN